ncbi:MAG: outer membrane lipoprotein chaperone LolA [Thermodesulfobacteriota bacterium]
MKKFLIISIFFVLNVIAAASADSPDIEAVVGKVQENYEKIHSYHADFTQEAEVKALSTVQKADGEVWFKKPGLMRWNYYKPNKDEIVSDGKSIWYYSAGENQVIESPIENMEGSDSSTTLLSGLGNLKKLFNYKFSSASATDSSGNYLVDLSPREQDIENFSKVTIMVDKKSYMVNRIFLYDPFGNTTTINLKNLEINKNISDSTFTFKKPKNAEIVKVPLKK